MTAILHYLLNERNPCPFQESNQSELTRIRPPYGRNHVTLQEAVYLT
jgi:hypothetical protein